MTVAEAGGYHPTPPEIVELAVDSLIEPAVGLIQASPDWCAELAVDLVETKGEDHVVHRLFHALRTIGAHVSLEDARRDLVVHLAGHDVVLEAKTIHALQLLNPTRTDGGFRSFEHRTTDLASLRAGTADVLLAIVPRFHKGVHRKYPRQVGPHELVPFGYPAPNDVSASGHAGALHELVGQATVLAQEWAAAENIRLVRRLPLDLRCPSVDLWIDVTLFMFTRQALQHVAI